VRKRSRTPCFNHNHGRLPTNLQPNNSLIDNNKARAAFFGRWTQLTALRVEIYHGLEKWDLMQEIAQRLREASPQNVQWVISYAYATRRSESVDAATNILINSLPKFPQESIIYYNLACYECQSNRIDSAKQYLKQVFRLDPNWRLEALEDEDLKPLWDYLGGLNKGHQLQSPLLDSFEK
jgi:tetratricopeptide (TPR) repeat protein